MKLEPRATAAGVRLIAHEVLGSTNAEALNLARQGERGPLWVTADRQSAGRGRRRRAWISPPGNLYASLLLTRPAAAQHWPQLSFVAALAIHDAVVEVAADLKPRLAIKWPNDLLLAGAKFAGILIEGEGDVNAVAVGIGVNCADASRNGMPARAFRPSAPTGLPARAAWAKACACALPSANSSAVSRRSTRPAPWCCAWPTAVPRRSLPAMCSRPRPRPPTRRVDRNTDMVRPSDELVFAPLGGVGEIGMNLAVYGLGDEHRRQWIAVDFGIAFADDALPGVDLIMPDIRYLEEERRNLLGIVLTHAHEDHFGALLDLWPRLKLPVYATPFTAALLQAKLEGEPGAPEIPVNIVPLGGRFDSRIERPHHPHAARQRASLRRLEDRSDPGYRPTH